MRNGNSFFYPSYGADAPAIDAGLSWLLNHPASRKIVVFCSVRNGQDISCSSKAKPFFDQLYKKRELLIHDQKYFFATPDSIPYGFAGVALLIHLSPEALDKADSQLTQCDAFYIPWSTDELQNWVARWGAVNVLTNKAASQTQLGGEILEMIANSSAAPNIIHTSDHNSMLDTLTRIHRQQQLPLPAEIREFLIRKSWSPEAATNVADMAERIAQGRTVRRR